MAEMQSWPRKSWPGYRLSRYPLATGRPETLAKLASNNRQWFLRLPKPQSHGFRAHYHGLISFSTLDKANLGFQI